MRATYPNHFLVLLVVLAGALCSCGNDGIAQQQAPSEPSAPGEVTSVPEAKLERISSSEIGKLRSRIGKQAIVFGKISGTSTSGSGHHFLNFTSGFKVICLKDHVGKFGKGGPAEIYRGKLIEVQGEIASHQGKPQIAVESAAQIKVVDLNKGDGGAGGGKKFEMLEMGTNTWISSAGLRYRGRDANGLTRKDHVLRHAKDQPNRSGSHGVFDAKGDGVFKLVDEAWAIIQETHLRPNVEGDSETYSVPMGRRIGYLGGKTGARKNKPALKSIFIVVRKGTKDVVTAFPR